MLSTGVELTTAATNLLNAVITAILMAVLFRKIKTRIRIRVWGCTLGLFFVVCVLGTVVHGIDLAERSRSILWGVLYSVMAFMIAGYVVAILYETYGKECIAGAVKINISVAVAFIIVKIFMTVFSDAAFGVFLIYCGCYLPVMLGIILSRIREKTWCGWFLAGVVLLVIGSILQTDKTILIHIGAIELNYNAVYHFFTIVFILLQFVGALRAEHKHIG